MKKFWMLLMGMGVFLLRIAAVHFSKLLQMLTYGNWRVFPSSVDVDLWELNGHLITFTAFSSVFFILPAYALAWLLRRFGKPRFHFGVDTILAAIIVVSYPFSLLLFFANCEGYSAAWGEGKYIDDCHVTVFGIKYFTLEFLQQIWQAAIYVALALVGFRGPHYLLGKFGKSQH